MENRIQEELEAKFERGQVKKREGKYEYVEVRPVIKRLNDVLGHDGWGFRITERFETDVEFVVFGEMTVWSKDGVSVSKMQCGRKKIVFKKETKIPVDIGNDWKAAISDCIKKCSTLFGVGLYLSENEYRPSTDSGRRGQSNNPPPPPDDIPPDTSDTPGSASDEVTEMRKLVHGLEAKVLAMNGGTRNELRLEVLNSLLMPNNMNGLGDYQARLEDLLAQGRDA